MDIDQLVRCVQSDSGWVDYLSALLVPTIAIVATLIAFQQWRINRARLKHELFDRRYEYYSVVKAFIASIISHGECRREDLNKFMIGTRGMRFIFSKEIASYIDGNIWDPAIDLSTLNAELEGLPVGEERSENVKRQGEIKKKLYREIESLDEKFSDYLQLEH